MIAGATIVVAWALATPSSSVPPAPASDGWEKLYEASGKDQWFTAVWLTADGGWRAGGRNLIVAGDGTGVQATPIDGFVVHAFGEDKSVASSRSDRARRSGRNPASSLVSVGTLRKGSTPGASTFERS